MKIRPIILAGGSGSRLWPSSRARHPKQFLNMHGDHTMLQATLKRLDGLEIESSVILCNEEHRFLVAEQLREIDRLGMIILEPEGKNTAPAVALAALAPAAPQPSGAARGGVAARRAAAAAARRLVQSAGQSRGC